MQYCYYNWTLIRTLSTVFFFPLTLAKVLGPWEHLHTQERAVIQMRRRHAHASRGHSHMWGEDTHTARKGRLTHTWTGDSQMQEKIIRDWSLVIHVRSGVPINWGSPSYWVGWGAKFVRFWNYLVFWNEIVLCEDKLELFVDVDFSIQ